MSKHTPGPWWAQGSRVAADSRGNTQLAAMLSPLARMYGPNSHGNARLIAAAPELLEALTWMVEIHDNWADKQGSLDWVLEKSRAALAKAGVS